MKVETKIKRFIQLREEILKDSKKWKGDHCPLANMNFPFNMGHRELAQILDGLGCWKWNCPFCNEEFSD